MNGKEVSSAQASRSGLEVAWIRLTQLGEAEQVAHAIITERSTSRRPSSGS